MSITGVLIILGCLVAGYWIVSSIMGPGIDLPREGRKADEREAPAASDRPASPASKPVAGHSKPAPLLRDDAPMRDWYIVLDVAANASRGEIQAAMKRRLAQAEANGDQAGVARIRRAADTGLALR